MVGIQARRCPRAIAQFFKHLHSACALVNSSVVAGGCQCRRSSRSLRSLDMLTICTVASRSDIMRRSTSSLDLPHSATSSANGDEIRRFYTEILRIHDSIRHHKLKHVGSQSPPAVALHAASFCGTKLTAFMMENMACSKNVRNTKVEVPTICRCSCLPAAPCSSFMWCRAELARREPAMPANANERMMISSPLEN